MAGVVEPATDLPQGLIEAEAALWRQGAPDALLADWQAAHREYEARLAQRAGGAGRHHFVVVIPVADRPAQLRDCLDSLLAECRAFHYGGWRAGRFPALSVVIADDSADPASRRRHAALAGEYSAQGLLTRHFDQPEQLALARAAGDGLEAIIGADPGARGFGLKGASRMRNISYLLLRRLVRDSGAPLLFFFIDSDQEFRLRLADGRERLAVSHFHALDRLFRARPIELLTGKVVGDPPVSPAVMAATLLDDVQAFLQRLAASGPDAPCGFHAGARGADDAAYHDMADLFGFRGERELFDYHCDLDAAHDQRAALARFAVRLERFFDGEHPTRISHYQPLPLEQSIAPARTVYTGNYVLRASGLRFFIPFADLGLRMAGPTLGRIARAELGERFVSANLPLLHRRTQAGTGRAEFRPGVERNEQGADLCGEFERQFYGDVMLFSVESLCESGGLTDRGRVERVVETTHRRLGERYALRRRAIEQGLARVRAQLESPTAWWNQDAASAPACACLRRFLDALQHNFGADSPCQRLIDAPDHRAARLSAIRQAIHGLERDRMHWREALARIAAGP